MAVVAAYDRRGCVLWASKWLHHDPDDVIGTPAWQDTVEGTESLRCAMGLAVMGEEPGPVEAVYQIRPSYRVITQFHPAPEGVAVIGISRPVDERISMLSVREREILTMLPSYTSREIAKKLGCSVSTVDTHRARVSRKLGLRGTALLAWVLENC